jgi:hypothetical protein
MHFIIVFLSCGKGEVTGVYEAQRIAIPDRRCEQLFSTENGPEGETSGPFGCTSINYRCPVSYTLLL